MTSGRFATVVAIAATLAGAAPAAGATFAVNSTVDAVDASPGDGVCETATGSGVCPLRAAIMEANALAGADVVTVPAGTHTIELLVSPSETDTEAEGDFDVTDELDLVGAGATVTDLYGKSEWLFDGFFAPHRVIDVAAGTVARVSALTIRGGMTFETGGGIANAGDLTLSDCVVRDNWAGFTVGNNEGGGIANAATGTLTVSRCRIASNRALSNGGGIVNAGIAVVKDSTVSTNAAVTGAGIANMGTLTVRNSTISGNVGLREFAAGSSFSGAGAGIAHHAGHATLEHVTVTNNLIPAATFPGIFGSGAGLGVFWQTFTAGFTLRDTIVSGNVGPEVASGSMGDCGTPAPTSLGHNLDGDGTCMLTGTGDLPATDPALGPLQDNGGPTATHAIAPGSPPHDAGDAGVCPPADQRGVPRPQDAGCDIGAYESNFPCGNGMLDAGEACDDGSPGGEDCCSVACELVASGGACEDSNVCTDSQCDGAGACVVATYAPAGTACALDAIPCTVDQCDGAGTCTAMGTMPCPPCEQCLFNICVSAPRTDCRRPTGAGGSSIRLKPDRLVWRWAKGALTEADDFGDPAATDDYTFCVFESYLGSVGGLITAELPAGGTCLGDGCWTALGNPPGARGWRYLDATRSQEGLEKIFLRPGADGKALIRIKGKGPNVGLPTPLGVDLPLIVQLQRDEGACWEATYSDPIVSTGTTFKAKSDP